MVTLINMFDIGPEHIDEFLPGWRERAEFMSRQPGFRSLRLYRALQSNARFALVNVAEWDSAGELSAATSQPFFQDSVRRSVEDFGAAGEPALYEMVLQTSPVAVVPKPYRVGALVRFSNAFMRAIIRAGIKMGTFAILTVPGRRTGRLINTPLVVFPHDGDRYLVASYGNVNWVRNIRASGGRASLTFHGHRENIVAGEVPIEQAAVILQESLRQGPPGIPRLIVRGYRRFFVLPYLDVDLSSSLSDFRRSALDHPIFKISQLSAKTVGIQDYLLSGGTEV